MLNFKSLKSYPPFTEMFQTVFLVQKEAVVLYYIISLSWLNFYDAYISLCLIFFMEKGAQSIAWLGTILHLCINWNKECSQSEKRPQETIIQSRQNTCPHLQIRINYSCEEKKELSSCPLLPKGFKLNIKRNTILLHLHSYILFYKKVQQLVATSIYLTACSTIPLKCFHICQAPLEKNAGIIAGAAI